jgi:LPXTG-site transpeptidase (sortase) family protein
VERLERSVNIYGGATLESMGKGAAHFSFTGLDNGNIGLIGHNRGTRTGFFSFVKLLQDGDIIKLEIDGTVRVFEVFIRTTVDDTDFTHLQQFGDNRLTLVTCVEDESNKRRVAVAREILEGGI